MMVMKQKQLLLAFASFVSLSLQAQTKLSLDSCRTLALQNNKQLSIAKVKKNVSKDVKKAIRTKYLPKIDVVAGYEFFNKEISLLNDQQKGSLSHLGSNFSQNIVSTMGSVLGTLAQQGVLNPQVATQLGAIAQKLGSPFANFGDKIGEELTRAFRTDTRNIWSGAVMVKQPIYLGGAIVAANKMASIGEDFAENNIEVTRQNVLYSTDQAYWLVVSLKQK
jgi:outer membrane efflux protein